MIGRPCVESGSLAAGLDRRDGHSTSSIIYCLLALPHTIPRNTTASPQLAISTPPENRPTSSFLRLPILPHLAAWTHCGPEESRQGALSGDQALAWSAWQAYLAQRDQPRPLGELLPSQTLSLAWALAEIPGIEDVEALRSRLAAIAGPPRGRRTQQLVDQWLGQANVGPTVHTPGVAAGANKRGRAGSGDHTPGVAAGANKRATVGAGDHTPGVAAGANKRATVGAGDHTPGVAAGANKRATVGAGDHTPGVAAGANRRATVSPGGHAGRDGSRCDCGRVLEALAWCHALPGACHWLGPDAWWQLLQSLLVLAGEAADVRLAEEPLLNQLLAGELRLALASLFPEIEACRKLGGPARESLSAGLVDLLDGEGVPHGKYLDLLRPLLACWTRVLAQEGCCSDAAKVQYQWLVLSTLRLARCDGTHVFSTRPATGRGRAVGDAELLQAALRLGGDEQDRTIAGQCVSGPASGRRVAGAANRRRTNKRQQARTRHAPRDASPHAEREEYKGTALPALLPTANGPE